MGEGITGNGGRDPRETKRLVTAKKSFNELRFGEEVGSDAANGFVGNLNRWWEDFCRNNKLNAEDENLSEFAYHFIRLAVNAFNHAKDGEVAIILGDKEIVAVVMDEGETAIDVSEQMESNPDFSKAYAYADKFEVETGGKKYAKTGKQNMKFVITSEPSATKGFKITIAKNLEKKKETS